MESSSSTHFFSETGEAYGVNWCVLVGKKRPSVVFSDVELMVVVLMDFLDDI